MIKVVRKKYSAYNDRFNTDLIICAYFLNVIEI